MASTFSTNLALELIGTGDQAGSWGNTTNTNLGTLIEQAISGYVTQGVTTGNTTSITIPDGASGVARNMFIELTGTGGTNTVLAVPANKKLYFIYNNTSGAVTVKVGAGTGVSVAATEKKILVSNGTDIVEATSYLTAVGGSLTLTTLTATSATITNLTSTSLTLSNNPTLSGGTANGVLYLDGSKVATSGTSLAYDGTNLSLGAAWTNNPMRPTTAPLYFQYASTGNNILAVMGDNVVSSVQVNRFSDNTTAPNINMGKARGTYASPTAVQTGDFLGNLQFRGYGGTTSRILASIDGLVETYTSDTNIASALYFATSSSGVASATEKMRLDSSGNLGLGVTPSAWSGYKALQLGGGSLASFSSNAFIELLQNAFWDGSNYKYVNTGFASEYLQNSGKHVWRTVASGTAGNTITFTDAMTLDASGNLGLGGTPSAWESNYRVFDIGTNGTVYNYANGTMAVGNNLYVTSGVFKYKISSYAPTLYAQFTGQHAWYTAASGTAGNTITFTQAMTLDASGRLGIGTTSPASGTRLHMVDSAGCILRLVRTSNRFDLIADTDFLDINARDSGTYLRFLTADTERARITATGNLLVGTTTDVASRSGTISDISGNVRAIPRVGSAKTAVYTLAISDVGQYVELGTGGGIDVPNGIFSTGDVVSVFNNTTGNRTISLTITTAYLAGTDADKASVTLATRGVATILFISNSVCVVSGNVT